MPEDIPAISTLSVTSSTSPVESPLFGSALNHGQSSTISQSSELNPQFQILSV